MTAQARGVNIPLLRKAVEWAEEQEQLDELERQWEQASWLKSKYDKAVDWMYSQSAVTLGQVRVINTQRFLEQHPECGTSYCIAGYVAQLVDPAYMEDEYGGQEDVDGLGSEAEFHSSKVAQRALGLTTSQAQMLFDGDNARAYDIRHIAETIAGEPL